MSGMPIDGGGGLGAQVALFRVKIERADAVVAVRAGEPYTALDALDTVRLHFCIVTLRKQGGLLDGVAAKVTGERRARRRDPGSIKHQKSEVRSQIAEVKPRGRATMLEAPHSVQVQVLLLQSDF